MTSLAEDASTTIRLYEVFPKRLKVGLVLCIAGLLYFPLVGITFKSIPWVFQLMAVFTVLTFCRLALNFLQLLGLSRPALVINDAGITFRNIQMPWKIISSVAPIRITQGTRLGIELLDRDKVYVRENLIGQRMLLRALHRSVDRHGAVLIPPMKNMDINELASVITQELNRRG